MDIPGSVDGKQLRLIQRLAELSRVIGGDEEENEDGSEDIKENDAMNRIAEKDKVRTQTN